MSYVERANDILIDENTTHELEITVKDVNGNPIDLSLFDVIFTSDNDNRIEKRCSVEDNVVTVILNASETSIPIKNVMIYTRRFQIRAFKKDIVYHICEGNLKIKKVHQNYLDVPAMEEVENG